MPKISQLRDKYATQDLLREIRTGQGAADLMNVRALSGACGVPYATLLRRLQNPEDFTLGEIRKLVSALPLHPFVLLAFIGYSKKDIKKYTERNETNA